MNRLEEKYSDEKMKLLEEMAQPLVEFLNKNYNPHTSIIIANERIVVIEDVLSIPFSN